MGAVVAYLRKQGNKWRAEVERNGVRRSASFDTKTAAHLWALQEEAEILSEKNGGFPKKTFSDALDRYALEVSSGKAGERFELLRMAAFKRDFPTLAGKQLVDVSTADLAGWRDARLAKVSKGSVQRDINLLAHVFTKAVDEWQWASSSPFKGLQAPGDNPSRERLPTISEIRRIVRWLGYKTGKLPKSKQEEAAFAFMLSLRTGMRAGEVLQLGPSVITGSVATVKHKMQYRTGKPRKIPHSKHALRLLKGFNGFTISSESLDVLFRRARDSLLIEDLHFHDARAYALTLFSKKVDVMELARISGHKDLRILLTVYYRTTEEEIAARLG